jgi:hypothetical protein
MTLSICSTRINPTFLLKGIDIHRLIAEYQMGAFNRPWTYKKKIKIAQTTTSLAPKYGDSNKDPIFSVKDKHNSNVVFATSGHNDFEVFTRTGGALPVGGRCGLCGDDFIQTALGYPIGYQEQILLLNQQEEPLRARYRITYIFWVEGRFCSFECALGYIRLILARPADFRDPTLRDSERMLKILFSLTYPHVKTPLRPAQDPRLLQSNGGSLTKEQWQDTSHVYVRTDRVLLIPAKVEYLQQNFASQTSIVNYKD